VATIGWIGHFAEYQGLVYVACFHPSLRLATKGTFASNQVKSASAHTVASMTGFD